MLLFQFIFVQLTAQNKIGAFGGGTINRLFDYANDDSYETNFDFGFGFSISAFHEMEIDTVTNFRTELQYRYQELSLEVHSSSSNNSFYDNIYLSSQQINLNLEYILKLNSVQSKNKWNLIFGPSINYNLKTKSIGNGWYDGPINTTDTSGNPIVGWGLIYWNKSDNNSKHISSFNVGGNLGLEFSFKIKKNMEFIIQNKYNFIFTNVLRLDLKYTSIFSTCLNIGIKFGL